MLRINLLPLSDASPNFGNYGDSLIKYAAQSH